MVIEQRFDRRYGKGAFDRLRSMLKTHNSVTNVLVESLG
jgi:hypothetical protein